MLNIDESKEELNDASTERFIKFKKEES